MLPPLVADVNIALARPTQNAGGLDPAVDCCISIRALADPQTLAGGLSLKSVGIPKDMMRPDTLRQWFRLIMEQVWN